MRGRCAMSLFIVSATAFAGDWSSVDLHPRPDWARPWVNLNGLWNFDFDPGDVGLRERWYDKHTYSKRINVPFPWQSELSGVHDTEYNGIAWYEREITIPADAGPRIVVVFGAIDWAATVWINGEYAGEHEGGYTPFEVELTGQVKAGQKARLTVRAVDHTDADLPTGKQIGWYTRTGGIWQTVYLESRGNAEILPSRIVPDIDRSVASFQIPLRTLESGYYQVTITATHQERRHSVSKSVHIPAEGSTLICDLPIPKAALWSPDSPSLYKTRIELSKNGTIQDTVDTYFGMRKVSRGTYAGSGHEYILLNNKPIYLRGALHQSFNSKGIYTHPDDDYIRRDYEIAKAAGLNMLRIHIKVDEPRALYWADRLGILLMCDTPNFWKKSERSRVAFESTLRAQIARDFNHPSIFAWVNFNETWGIGDKGYDRDTQEWVRDMYLLTKQLDPTRLVEDNSPCYYDHTVTDINSWHFYIDRFEQARDHIQEVVEKTYPGSPFNFAEGWKQDTAPLMNSEYGGVSAGSGDRDISWVFLFLTNLLRKHERICGYVYTELSDIEWEHNGFVNYDRSPKEYPYPADISLADLQGEDFPVLDCPPYQAVRPGDRIRIPLLLSHWSERDDLVIRTSLHGTTVEGDPWPEHTHRIDRVEARPFGVTPMPPIEFVVPQGQGIMNVVAEVLHDGKRIGANYCVLNVLGEGAWSSGPRFAVSFPVEEFSSCSVTKDDPLALAHPGKAYRHTSGFLEYRIRFPKSLKANAIEGCSLMAEIGAKADRERVEWPERVNRQDYPQTDGIAWPSEITVFLNGNEVKTLSVGNDYADALGVLSHAAQFHHGSRGDVVEIPFTGTALDSLKQSIRKGTPVTLRFEVKPDSTHVGGLALYGRNMGQHPADPAFVFSLAPDAERPVGGATLVDSVSSRMRALIKTGPNGQKWSVAFQDPGDRWMTREFDDSRWKMARSGFGTEGTPGARLGTRWDSPDIWLRCEINLPTDFGKSGVWLDLHHDESVEIFVNGLPLLERKGYVTDYERIHLSPGQISLFEPGKKNVIAVHCHQTGGGQYVDVGLMDLKPGDR